MESTHTNFKSPSDYYGPTMRLLYYAAILRLRLDHVCSTDSYCNPMQATAKRGRAIGKHNEEDINEVVSSGS